MLRSNLLFNERGASGVTPCHMRAPKARKTAMRVRAAALGLCFSVAVAVFPSADLHAAVIVHVFRGQITSVSGFAGIFVGNPFTGTLCYNDAQAPVVTQINPDQKKYPNYTFSLVVLPSNTRFDEDPSSTLSVINNAPFVPFGDAFASDATNLGFAGFNLTDSTGAAFASTDLPNLSVNILQIGNFDSNFVVVGGNNPRGDITSIFTLSLPFLDDCKAPALDHFKCWQVKDLRRPRFVQIPSLPLDDQFALENVEVKKPFLICAPADKDGSGINDPNTHQCCYKIKGANLAPRVNVEITDQFGTLQLEVKKPKFLCQPCTKCVLQETQCLCNGVPVGVPPSGPCTTQSICAPLCQPNETPDCLSFDCASLCGNGMVELFCCEECDDGNTMSGDGCSSSCQVE